MLSLSGSDITIIAIAYIFSSGLLSATLYSLRTTRKQYEAKTRVHEDPPYEVILFINFALGFLILPAYLAEYIACKLSGSQSSDDKVKILKPRSNVLLHIFYIAIIASFLFFNPYHHIAKVLHAIVKAYNP
jgi:hypothetical protein